MQMTIPTLNTNRFLQRVQWESSTQKTRDQAKVTETQKQLAEKKMIKMEIQMKAQVDEVRRSVAAR